MHVLQLAPDDGTELDRDALIPLYRPDQDHHTVRVNFVTSIDGATEVDGYSAGLSGEADKLVFGVLRMFADGLLVGAGTMRQENYKAVRLKESSRDWRTAAGLERYPRLIVVSGRLDLDPAHPALADAPIRPVVLTHAASDPGRRDALAGVADVLVHGAHQVDLTAALTDVRERYGVRHILCEGGPHLFGSLYAADLVDEVCLTLSPVQAGPGAGRIIAGPPGQTRQLRLMHAITDRGALLLRYGRWGQTD